MSKVFFELISPKLEVSPNIAIVGSSGRLLENPRGKEIDQFDDVVRFNRAPTEGWEEFCGSKTTIHAANSHVFIGSRLNRGDWVQNNTNFIRDIKNTKIVAYCNGGHFARKDSCVHSTSKAYQLTPSCNKILKNSLKLDCKKQMSLGVCFIALCVYSGIKPHLFGFDIEEDRQRDHYWEKRGPASKFHKPSEEKAMLKKLISAGLIEFYL